ncbi:MAG: ATP-binding cassette domain-containing protein [Acidobacteriota bacterium]
MSGKAFQLEKVSRAFGAVEVLRELSLTIARGEFVAVVGPSGCGKTTLLNLLSGYDQPSSGVIQRDGEVRRVYQQDGLFPWLTVAENIALGLRHLKDEAERTRQTNELLRLIRLESFDQHYPHQLSGGDAAARGTGASAGRSLDILLLDEPAGGGLPDAVAFCGRNWRVCWLNVRAPSRWSRTITLKKPRTGRPRYCFE